MPSPDFLRKFDRARADDTHLTQSQLLVLLSLRLGLDWTWYRVEVSVQHGLPWHPHPTSRWRGRKAYSWREVLAWLRAQGLVAPKTRRSA